MRTVYLLGAGFSCAAGLPLGSELFKLVMERARARGLGHILESDVERYLDYKERAEGCRPPEGNINLEDLMSFLDIEHYLGLTRGRTFSREGNIGQMLVRNLLAEVLHQRQTEASQEQLQPYIAFAERLGLDDWIYTFNNDTLLEQSLETVEKPYRLFPDRCSYVADGVAFADTHTNEVVIAKLHGSIDWFSVQPLVRGLERALADPTFYGWHHGVFSEEAGLVLHRLVDGPRPEDDELRHVYRVERLGEYLSSTNVLSQAPLIASPSYHKELYLGPLREFWRGFGQGSWNSQGLTIVGFSLAAHDEYVRQAAFNLVTEFQSCDETLRGGKANLKMVDLKPTEEERAEYRRTFCFVDWSKTDCYFDGFGVDALPFLFD